MESKIVALRQLTRNYTAFDNELRGLNNRVYELRDARKSVEQEMVEILKQDEFKGFDKLKNQEDGSIIRIQRPQTWSKPWSISQKELKAMLDSYFDSTKNSNSTDCFNYILTNKKATLVADEFAITRTVTE
jgi:uncharacterized protein (UPF0335 family)